MFTNLDTVWRRGQNTSSPVSLDSALDLSEDELEMLRLYRALPKSEQQAQLSEPAPALRILIACSPSY